MNAIRTFVLALAAVALAGCVTQPMGAPRPSMNVVEKIRAADLPAMKVGGFERAASLPARADASHGIRALTLVSPVDKSFAKYLGKTIEEDLKAAGKLDANADLVVEGQLTESMVDAPIGTGTAALGAKFVLKRAGQPVFEKHLMVDDKWESAFLGAIAIPDAANHYSALFDKLVLALFTEADFVSAAKQK